MINICNELVKHLPKEKREDAELQWMIERVHKYSKVLNRNL